MKNMIGRVSELGIFRSDLDYHLVRGAMVFIFLIFGYQKFRADEAQALVPLIEHGPLIFWLHPVFGVRGAGFFLGTSEWVFGALIFLGYWNKLLGVLGDLGAIFSFFATLTVIPFLPGAWAASAGGFPAMGEGLAFLMKDWVLLAASFYLLKQDLAGC